MIFLWILLIGRKMSSYQIPVKILHLTKYSGDPDLY